MNRKDSSSSFERFRRERAAKGQVRSVGSGSSVANEALRELEAYENKEMEEERLRSEVTEFFDQANRQAAVLVDKVARAEREQSSSQLSEEMQAFLSETMRRMTQLVTRVMNSDPTGRIAEANLDASMSTITGPVLDGFRQEGTSETSVNHIGKNPLAVDLAALRREIDAILAEEGPAPEVVPEKPLRAMVDVEAHPIVDLMKHEGTPAGKADSASTPEATPSGASVGKPAFDQETIRFREVLRGLVRKGLMSEEEARSAWYARRALARGAGIT